ncbi:hypothetical protein Taro_019838 [Colocasia esculenta]|uniref:hAT-like transposase RNase-H fold domain-containing protein n=1 Tax=Colocasia esculenta TaxID=4460 RepID=A0A843UXW8_COLES|nr:hypothetical protein [Colocasia esculenta]
MLVMHEYPFSMVEHCGFVDFVKSLQPQFKMFTKNTHKEDCIKLYEKEKDKMCKFFNKITFRVTLTADIWTSSNMVSYISLTCHFIDDDWRLQKKILNFLSFQYPHSGEEIYKTIKKLLVDWNLDKKLCSIVLDNALSNDKFLFYSITKRFSSVKSPTSNMYFNDLCLVNLQLNNWSKHAHLFIVRMVEKMHAKFKKYWDMNNMLLSIASVLDPRYKIKSMEYLYMTIFSNPFEVKEKIDDVRASFEYLYNAYVEQVKKVARSPHILTHTGNNGSHDTCFGVGGVFELSSCVAFQTRTAAASLSFEESRRLGATAIARVQASSTPAVQPGPGLQGGWDPPSPKRGWRVTGLAAYGPCHCAGSSDLQASGVKLVGRWLVGAGRATARVTDPDFHPFLSRREAARTYCVTVSVSGGPGGLVRETTRWRTWRCWPEWGKKDHQIGMKVRKYWRKGYLELHLHPLICTWMMELDISFFYF